MTNITVASTPMRIGSLRFLSKMPWKEFSIAVPFLQMIQKSKCANYPKFFLFFPLSVQGRWG
jgi:hypothetical protein